MYCTYLTIYRGNKLPPFYIGSSTIEKINNGYHGSVKSKTYKAIWETELKYNLSKFKTIIISTHLTRIEALTKENSLQVKLQAHKNSMYINKATAHGEFGILTNGFNQQHKQDTKNKISVGIKLAYAEGRLISPFKTMNFSGENNPFYNKIHTEETKIKMRKPKKFVPKKECPYCYKVLDHGNYTKYHGVKCKLNQ